MAYPDHKHFLSIADFSRVEIEGIFHKTDKVRELWEPISDGMGAVDLLQRPRNKCIACFFAEPSTRTRFSFERAMHRLGGQVITAADASTSSSLTKGESLKDTFRTLGQYADAIVMRHKDENWPEAARKYSRVPVINAGSGAGEHPTQALLDLYTIRQHFGDKPCLNIMFCGDLKYGRTVHSLVQLLRLFDHNVHFCPATIGNERLSMYGELSYHPDIAKTMIHEMDVVYMTRLQKERWQGVGNPEFLRLDVDMVSRMNPSSIILHPLPRNDEITEEVDNDPRAAYHERQVRNGLYVRTALLDIILNE